MPFSNMASAMKQFLQAVQHSLWYCRYEGEFAYGFAHGMGMHTTARGEIYRGDYLLGKRHG